VDTQVLVVGAGPVGLLLAGELRLAGAEVIVLEQRDRPTGESRASTLHARTMELFDSRGLVAALGAPPADPRGHFGGIPLDLSLPSAYPGQWKVPQTRTERVLGRWAADLGADVRRGHTVRRVSDLGDRVVAEADGPHGPVRLSARFLVACDGENSAVRRLTGAAVTGSPATRELLRCDVDGITVPDRRFQRLERGLAIAARRPDGVTRVMVHEFGRPAVERTGPPEFAEVAATWRRVTGEDISAGRPIWVNAFGDASLQVDSYRIGRVLFAGDAAHRQMPVGGQALNLGLQDAANLGWKLAARVRGLAGDALLDTYHDERHAVGRRVLAAIAAQTLLLLGGDEVESLRAVVGELIAAEEVRAHLAGTISGLDIRYDLGPADDPAVGARVPPAAVETADGPVTTTALLRPGAAVLLDFSGDEAHRERLRAVARPWRTRLTVVAAAGPPPDLAGRAAVLVRPDGYVAWTAPGGEPLTDALPRHLGAADHRIIQRRGQPAMEPLAGKTALVTGASRGMGRATALRLAADGALVAVHYNENAAAAEEVVERIEKDGGRAFTVQAELGVRGDVHQLFLGLEEGLRERTGEARLDILVNNAGVMGGLAPEDTTPEAFDHIFAVNARAPFFLIQRSLRIMRDGGRIINISSGLTRVANPQEIAYAMSKGAVEQLAHHFAKLLGLRGITVNSVAPGITRNDNPVFGIPEVVEQMAALSAFGRVGEPEDVADVVAFLASDASRWITGAFVDATGGTLLG
jgi:NAD(P)-dependent dehydrogenase (short-subunit alcohol dehydrogenase family)/2-polyprenyl-6-methoxyphenol hydroxylase-like FAD-dependent oxidoreductase